MSKETRGQLTRSTVIVSFAIVASIWASHVRRLSLDPGAEAPERRIGHEGGLGAAL